MNNQKWTNDAFEEEERIKVKKDLTQTKPDSLTISANLFFTQDTKTNQSPRPTSPTLVSSTTHLRYLFFDSGRAKSSECSSCQLPCSPYQESEISEQIVIGQTEKRLSLQTNQARMEQPKKRRKKRKEGKRSCREEMISWLFKHLSHALYEFNHFLNFYMSSCLKS